MCLGTHYLLDCFLSTRRDLGASFLVIFTYSFPCSLFSPVCFFFCLSLLIFCNYWIAMSDVCNIGTTGECDEFCATRISVAFMIDKIPKYFLKSIHLVCVKVANVCQQMIYLYYSSCLQVFNEGSGCSCSRLYSHKQSENHCSDLGWVRLSMSIFQCPEHHYLLWHLLFWMGKAFNFKCKLFLGSVSIVSFV